MKAASVAQSDTLHRPTAFNPTFVSALQVSVAVAFLACMATIYWLSIPLEFNLKYEGRKFFDSDGEFITRQYLQAKTFTHNNHILYHFLTAKACYALGCGGNAHTIAAVHKSFSVAFGALGVATVLFASWWWLGRFLPALATALFLGGSASYWFFSATIDTYVPHVAIALTAVWLSLLALRSDNYRIYIALGLAIGLAFLFRTDGALCGVLAVVAIARQGTRWTKLLLCAVSGAAVGIIGYTSIAIFHYHVAPGDLVPWALGHLDRPEVGSGVWGSVSNLSASSLWLVFLNTFLYSVFIPGIEATRSPDFVRHYGQLAGGLLVPGLWGCTAAWAVISQFGASLRDREGIWLVGLAGIWFVPRVVFYTWWDPFDPFLFPILSLPSLLLLILAFLGRYSCAGQRPRANLSVGLVSMLALLVWLHNGFYLIVPLREFSLQ
jgi:hypothetical protein